MQWYYSKNGIQLGPVEQGELTAKLAAGEIGPGDMVWREGMADWQPSGQVNELQVLRPAVQSPTAGGAPSPYAPPTQNPILPGAAPMPSNGKATASLVLGIISCVFSLCSCYGMVVSIPCGILAVVFGNQVQRMALVDRSLAGELGKVRAGVITGWIGLGVTVVWVLVMFFVFGIAATGNPN